MIEMYGLNCDEAYIVCDLEVRARLTLTEHGPWTDEPDDLQWYEQGYFCRVRRAHLGNLCGYVGVDVLHPWWDQTWITLPGELVHGGFTFNEMMVSDVTGETFWTVGFDYGHFRDLVPTMHRAARNSPLYDMNQHFRAPEDYYYHDVPEVIAAVRALVEAAQEALDDQDAYLDHTQSP